MFSKGGKAREHPFYHIPPLGKVCLVRGMRKKPVTHVSTSKMKKMQSKCSKGRQRSMSSPDARLGMTKIMVKEKGNFEYSFFTKGMELVEGMLERKGSKYQGNTRALVFFAKTKKNWKGHFEYCGFANRMVLRKGRLIKKDGSMWGGEWKYCKELHKNVLEKGVIMNAKTGELQQGEFQYIPERNSVMLVSAPFFLSISSCLGRFLHSFGMGEFC